MRNEPEELETGQDALNFAVAFLQQRLEQLQIRRRNRSLSGIEILELHDLERTIALLQAFEAI